MKFTIKGHPNILATHKTTLEFTKDSHLTKEGDCIVGVNADFELSEIKQLLNKSKVTVRIMISDAEEIINAKPNPEFKDGKEMVIRMGDYKSARTFATHANKSAFMLSRELINKLKKGEKAQVIIE